MKIGSFREGSFQDYEGGLCSVLFTVGCNYSCPACHARNLLEGKACYNEETLLNRLERKKDYIKWIVISGGEPTMQPDLKYFIKKIKERGLAVKLDTNGNNFAILEELREEKLVDYVAMDVKGPPQLYPQLVGREFLDQRDDYQKSIAITTGFSGYEFRTTVVPVFRENGEASFMTVEEIVETAKLIYDCTGINSHKYFLQPFVPRDGGLIDSRLEKFPETPRELLEAGKEAAREYLPNCEIR